MLGGSVLMYEMLPVRSLVAVIVSVRRGSLLLVALFAAAAVLVTEALINLI